jgi:hypothetical protein
MVGTLLGLTEALGLELEMRFVASGQNSWSTASELRLDSPRRIVIADIARRRSGIGSFGACL